MIERMSALFIATVGHLISGVLFALLGIFVLSHNYKKRLYQAFSGFAICSGIFGVFLAVGINLPPSSPLAYGVWLVNAIDFFIVAFFFHFTLILSNREQFYKWAIRISYTFATLCFLGALAFPSYFLPFLSPKLFTLSYLNPGPIYYLMVGYFIVAPTIGAYELIRGYLKSGDDRRRYEYFMLALLLGYTFGFSDFFLVFNIPVSPVLGMLYGLYGFPIAYGILADDLLDIRIVAKRALVYSSTIALISGALIALIFFNNKIVAIYPWFSFWTIPTVSALVGFIIARFYWIKAVESDRLKYEFITVAAHKLRTPLTRIRWNIADLRDSESMTEIKTGIENINHSNDQLIEITNALLEAARTEDTSYSYKHEPVDLEATAHALVTRYIGNISEKQLQVSVTASEKLLVRGDPIRLSSAIEVLLQNSITYTPPHGSITMRIEKSGSSSVRFSITDTGIGVAHENQQHIFSRFFRENQARLTDTEGLGLGLSIAKNIIQKHHGKIGVDSDGAGKGSTFWFILPIK